MEDSSRKWGSCSNKELRIISQFRERIHQIEDHTIRDKIVNKDTNSLEFYKITPKDQLPKFLQKMRFQTLHLKEKDITKSIKIYKKENRKPEEAEIRKKLKGQGHIMLLSEIYQYLGEAGDIVKRNTAHSHMKINDPVGDLEQWEKMRKQEKFQLTQMIRKERPLEVRVSRTQEKEGNRVSAETTFSKQFREGSDYKSQIQRGLQIIEMTHASEVNMMNRYLLVQNSSKLLKKQLDDKKLQFEESIKSRMKLLYEARTEYHYFFEERDRLKLQERMLNDELGKDDNVRISHKSLSAIRNDKSSELRNQKKLLLDTNQSRISKTKKTIESLQQSISNLQEELRKVMVAQKLYFKISLKNGNDVRESGLVWIIKKLQIKEEDMNHYQYPQYLDKKSRFFLIQKAMSEDQMELLLQEKRKFVNQIGRATSEGKFKYKSIMSPKELLLGHDQVIQNDFSGQAVPKKYRRSLKKITQLNQEYIKNSSLLELRQKQRNKVFQISADLEGLSNKEIYSQIGERIKKLDLSKMKKDKLGNKKSRLLQYQSLLQKIKNIHIKLQQMDLQHQNHLLAHYRDNKNLYFMQSAACFGYKRAYSMIIKYFSWKSYHDQPK